MRTEKSPSQRSSLLSTIFFSLLLSSCGSISYMSHITAGQMDLLWKRQNIEELLEQPDLPIQLRNRLELAQELRNFSAEVLALPVGQAYSSYSDLERPYAVWNVYAAPELSMEAYTWCYPIVGCMAYRGYYDKKLAVDEGNRLEKQGYDVRVGGVRAYSTLGYFDDPILNSFVYSDEVYFVELLIHEIAHRKLFIKDDTRFNENFATAVGELGAQRWFTQADKIEKFELYQQSKANYQKVVSFLLVYKEKLEALYSNQELSKSEKISKKTQLLSLLAEDFNGFKNKQGLDNRYDTWVTSMNNASFSTLANYHEFVPKFIAMFEQVGRDWQKFYSEVERISKLPKVNRDQTLRDLPSLSLGNFE